MQDCHRIHQVNNTPGEKEKTHTTNLISYLMQIALALLFTLLPHFRSLWFAVLLFIKL